MSKAESEDIFRRSNALHPSTNPYQNTTRNATRNSAPLPPFLQRILSERDDLDAKIGALHRFILSEEFKKIAVNQQKLLTRQAAIMLDYTTVLTERLKDLQAPEAINQN